MNFAKIAAVIVPIVGSKLKVKPEVLAAVITNLPVLIDYADDFLEGVSGPDKLKAVMAAFKADLAEIVDKIDDVFPNVWKIVSPAVSMYVALKRMGLIKLIAKIV